MEQDLEPVRSFQSTVSIEPNEGRPLVPDVWECSPLQTRRREDPRQNDQFLMFPMGLPSYLRFEGVRGGVRGSNIF